MKKFLLSFVVFAASAAYVAYQYVGGSSANAAALTDTSTQTATQIAVQTQPPSTPVAVVPVPSKPIAAVPKPVAPTSSPVVTTPTPAPTPVPVVVPTPAPVIAPKPQGQYVDGSYTGSAADAYYGLVQVQAIIQNGKLVKVNFLQYPNDRRTSQQINSQAMPELKSEAIQAQSANVSGVSGASDTSMAFIESLGNALAQAKKG